LRVLLLQIRLPLSSRGNGDHWFKSSLRNRKLLCSNKFRIPATHPN